MKFAVTITIQGDDTLYDYLKGEVRKQARGNLLVERAPKGVVVRIEAKDAVAFRSGLNTIGQSMAIWEKL